MKFVKILRIVYLYKGRLGYRLYCPCFSVTRALVPDVHSGGALKTGLPRRGSRLLSVLPSPFFEYLRAGRGCGGLAGLGGLSGNRGCALPGLAAVPEPARSSQQQTASGRRLRVSNYEPGGEEKAKNKETINKKGRARAGGGGGRRRLSAALPHTLAARSRHCGAHVRSHFQTPQMGAGGELRPSARRALCEVQFTDTRGRFLM
ncbi:hypothetical protein NDU88_002986 [Pleurodeles waltl]|uniref:Uncharacterized protein n=1 Tax=Pleurodeles waltl TaxID=8319 RepID=A0AAV7T3F2_PLEWA|nr:hypothetical protein NDU88_002986 [Pleurodeles waltl]